MNGRKSQILGTIHRTKYTATKNQPITSNQRFTTKPKVSKLLKIVDESCLRKKSSDTYTEKPTVSKSPEEENKVDMMMMMIRWQRW